MLIVSAIVPVTAFALWIGLTLVLWIEFFRLTRATVSRLLAGPAIEASLLLGFGPIHVFRRHLWPELAAMLLTLGAFGAATAVMTIAALGFVSVGVRPPRPELGLMMVEMLPYYREAPMALLVPVAATFVTLLGLNLVAGGAAHERSAEGGECLGPLGDGGSGRACLAAAGGGQPRHDPGRDRIGQEPSGAGDHRHPACGAASRRSGRNRGERS